MSDHGPRSGITAEVTALSTLKSAATTDQREHRAITLVLAVVASVAGALVTNAFATSQNLTFNASQYLALFGAVLGAAIPPIMAVTTRFPGVQLGAGLVICIIALVVTYGGFTVRDKVSNAPKTIFPVPGPLITSAPGSTCEGQGEGKLCISWSPAPPAVLICSKDPCEQEVTVSNTGTAVLKITGLVPTGDAAGRLSAEGTCAPSKSLQKGETCSVTVRAKPGESGNAQLRIQQNLSGDASLVNIAVDAWTDNPSAEPDLRLEPQGKCSVTKRASGNDTLTVPVGVRNSGPGQVSGKVPFTIVLDNGTAVPGSADVTADQVTQMTVSLKLTDYTKPHTLVVKVDPDKKIAEVSEANNTLTLTFTLLSRSAQVPNVDCRAS